MDRYSLIGKRVCLMGTTLTGDVNASFGEGPETIYRVMWDEDLEQMSDHGAKDLAIASRPMHRDTPRLESTGEFDLHYREQSREHYRQEGLIFSGKQE